MISWKIRFNNFGHFRQKRPVLQPAWGGTMGEGLHPPTYPTTHLLARSRLGLDEDGLIEDGLDEVIFQVCTSKR